MLPRMCTFIAEGVRVNVVQNNLALMIYLMRMVKALLINQSLHLEKYLHELIPSVSTCIRDFASRLMAQICKNLNTSTNNIQTRLTRMFSRALHGEKSPQSSLCGAIEGLPELGPEVIKVFIIPRIKFIAQRIEAHLDFPAMSNVDKIASGHIKHLLVKIAAPQAAAQPNTVVKFVTAANSCVGAGQKIATAGSKLVVVCMASASTTVPTVMSKPIFVQQGIKWDQIVPPPDIDDLPYLA
ncbi:TBP-associated factor 6 [Carabus blaptoides fortunei]